MVESAAIRTPGQTGQCPRDDKEAGQPGRGVVDRKRNWSNLWKITQARVGFVVRSYGRTTRFLVPGTSSSGFETSQPALALTRSVCEVTLSQRRYGWRHDQVLAKLAEVLERRRWESGARIPPMEHHVNFLREGGGRRSTRALFLRSGVEPASRSLQAAPVPQRTAGGGGEEHILAVAKKRLRSRGEVRQAAMPSTKFHLPVQSLTGI